MNTKKAFRNSLISIAGKIVALLLGFINRKIFVLFLNIELLGYQGLFSNIFAVLSIAEMGVGGVISYHLYRELAAENDKEISRLMYVYKRIYQIIGLIVFAVGIILSFFLEYLIKNPASGWTFIRCIYFLQLMAVVLGYFMVSYRTLYVCDQKEYKCIEIELAVSVVIQLFQIIGLFFFHDYILYLLLATVTSLGANMIIARSVRREYINVDWGVRVSAEYLRNIKLFKDLKNFIVHKLSYAVYDGTDNIIISMFCGIRDVALYGNYIVVKSGITQLMYRITVPLQATVGNIVYSKKNKKELWEQFCALDMFAFFLACAQGLGYFLFLPSVITVWLGEQYMFSDMFVLAFSITAFIACDFENVWIYRQAFGDYDIDRNYMVISMVLNIGFSVLLVHVLGVPGVQIGTALAFLPIGYGRSMVVVHKYFGQNLFHYLLKHGFHLLIIAGEMAVCHLVMRNVPVSAVGFLLRFGFWGIIVFGVNSLIFFRTKSFRLLLQYGRVVFEIAEKALSAKRKGK